MRLGIFLILFLGTASFTAQVKRPVVIKWEAPAIEQNGSFLQCEGCQPDRVDGILFSQVDRVPSGQIIKAITFRSYTTAALSEAEQLIVRTYENRILPQPQVIFKNVTQRKQPYVVYSFLPLVKESGEIKKITSFSLEKRFEPAPPRMKRNKSFVANSVLAQGDWYKVGVTEDGVYKIDYNFLENLGIDMGALNPLHINIYGNGAGMLSENNNDFRPDDLAKNAISFVGNEVDGTFDSGDYILFYANGPHRIQQNGSELTHVLHNYVDTSYYFIRIDGSESPKRITNQMQSTGVPTDVVTSFNDYAFHELEKLNFWESGKEFYGDTYNSVSSGKSYNFSMPNITSDPASVQVKVASRSVVSNDFTITAAGESATITTGSIAGQPYEYGKLGNATLSINNPPATITVTVNYDLAGSLNAEGYLNNIRVNARRNLIMMGNSMIFQDLQSVGAGRVADFQLSGANLVTEIWEVTDQSNVTSIQYTDGGATKSFVMDSDSLRKYVAITANAGQVPVAFGQVANQDLHSLGYADLILVTPGKLITQANSLADFHRNNGTSTHVVTTNQIYNEFSSGMRDATAIRQFLIMFYERAGTDPTLIPKHLLLFGDGSYDNKGKINSQENLIPTYQSVAHVSKTSTYTSDDYFVVLDPSASFSPTDLLDVSVGRLPISTSAEASAVVNKIIRYAQRSPSYVPNSSTCNLLNSSSTFGDWRNKIVMVSDDEDGGTYFSHTEVVASQIEDDYPWMNINKVHSDSYIQQSTPGGERFYDVYDEIKERVQEGVLAVNYIGHGGEVGWAEERFLDLAMINGWSNSTRLPIFMTATCEFSRFDDPDRTSAGELLVLNGDGGAIAMFTTWRLVYAGPNLTMNKKFYDTVFKRDVNGAAQTLGSIYVGTKNSYATAGASENGRKFGLLGDPALQFALPDYHIVADEINDQPIASALLDTLKALGKVKIEGHVEDWAGGTMTSFNGVVYLTVFDKPQQYSTLGNNVGSGVNDFLEQDGILYKGKATVTNGLFSFTFVAPKDINLSYGKGKLSFYADNGEVDATGYSDSLTVGGVNTDAATDNLGPEIRLFMNDSNFVYGGITDESPIMLAYISDSNGVNTTGNSIGHDLTATLDGNTAQSIVLNDQYEADLDTYQQGSVAYQFENLSEGTHTLELKAWDVYNNSSSRETQFVVANSAEMALEHVLNYPNPFTTHTEFMLEHNQVCNQADIQVQVFTVSGRLVKTINQSVHSDGYRISGITWDGRDDFGDKLARGTYFYRVKVSTDNGANAEKFERLVILK